MSLSSVKSERFFSIISRYSSSSLTSSSTSCAWNFSTCLSLSPVLNSPSPEKLAGLRVDLVRLGGQQKHPYVLDHPFLP